jgi:hypothetical protein
MARREPVSPIESEDHVESTPFPEPLPSPRGATKGASAARLGRDTLASPGRGWHHRCTTRTVGEEDLLESPRIRKVSWGSVVVEGVEGPFKDVKLFPGGARPWDWSETGTAHSPGVQPADLEELLDRGAVDVVVGTGMQGRLGVTAAARELVRSRGARLHVLGTEEAVRRYNEIAARRAVGAVIHSTC